MEIQALVDTHYSQLYPINTELGLFFCSLSPPSMSGPIMAELFEGMQH